VALSFQGIPAIYFHSLTGTRNWQEGVDAEGGQNRTINRRKWPRQTLDALLADESTQQPPHLHALHADAAPPPRPSGLPPVRPHEDLRARAEFFCFIRTALHQSERILCIFNFTAEDQKVPMARFEELGLDEPGGSCRDILSASTLKTGAPTATSPSSPTRRPGS
jgi:sucrose phosphorylase